MVYNQNQQCIRYLVEFCLPEDKEASKGEVEEEVKESVVEVRNEEDASIDKG